MTRIGIPSCVPAEYKDYRSYEDVSLAACVVGPSTFRIHTKTVCCVWVAPMLKRHWKDRIAADCRLLLYQAAYALVHQSPCSSMSKKVPALSFGCGEDGAISISASAWSEVPSETSCTPNFNGCGADDHPHGSCSRFGVGLGGP